MEKENTIDDVLYAMYTHDAGKRQLLQVANNNGWYPSQTVWEDTLQSYAKRKEADDNNAAKKAYHRELMREKLVAGLRMEVEK